MTTLQSGMSGLLQECLAMPGSDADRIAVSLADVDRFRLAAALRFLHRASSPFDVFFFIEALAAAGQRGKGALVKKFFRDHATTEDKIEIAAGWAFTGSYRFGTAAPLPVRHVMYSDCRADHDWILENVGDDHEPFSCSTGVMGLVSLCPCEQWLREKPAGVDRALDAVVGHLCDMRHSLVHESWPVFMVAEPAPATSLGSTVLDCYPCDQNDPEVFRTYEAGISFERFKTIGVRTARACLVGRYP